MSTDPLVCVKDFEKYAFSVLPRNALDYYRSGAGAETTLTHNRRAFSKYKIRPRCLRDVSKRDLSTVVLGQKIAMPIGISPTAMQRMAHPEGECANARAAQAMGTIYTLSTIATSSIEEVAEAAPNCVKWFQLYIYNDREVTKKLVQRAEKAGYKALVLTVDAPMFGLRLADVRNKFTLPPHLKLANFTGDKAGSINKTEDGSGLTNYVNRLFDASLQWDDVKWLKSITKLPIILKGILTAEDAILAADAGADGVQVSNHGGRQVDGTPASVLRKDECEKPILLEQDAYLSGKNPYKFHLGAGNLMTIDACETVSILDNSLNVINDECTWEGFLLIEALPEVVKAVGHRVEVYMDGGVTDGTDVFKALALGAKMVFIGRPALWGLTHSGEEGVKTILTILRTEFDYALALTGYDDTALWNFDGQINVDSELKIDGGAQGKHRKSTHGCASVKDIEPGMVVPESFYSRL